MRLSGSWTRVLAVCTAIAVGLLSIAALPGAAGAAPAQAKAAAHKKHKKKECKKRGKQRGKKCKRHQRKRDSSTAPASDQSQPTTSDAPDGGTCGPISKSTGGYWTCTFSDEFNGTSLDRDKWLPQQTATSGYVNGATACFVDSANNISVSGGTLKLTARREPPFDCGQGWITQYTSGMVTTAQGRFSQTYGRYEIRAKFPPAQVRGLQTSFWLWPVDATKYGEYPASGEIDIAEMFSQYPDRAIPFIHYKSALAQPNVTNNFCMLSNPTTFHTYTLEWSSTTMKISYDGQVCLVHQWDPMSPLSRPQPFDQPFFIALTQALGVGTNEFDPTSTPLPATTTVDYVRVWK
jgi:beta-glucanase (GH16 family)